MYSMALKIRSFVLSDDISVIDYGKSKGTLSRKCFRNRVMTVLKFKTSSLTSNLRHSVRFPKDDLSKMESLPNGDLDRQLQYSCKTKVLDRQLQDERYPNVTTYTMLIDATCKKSGVSKAMQLFDEMKSRGCKPDVVTYNILIEGICNEGRLDKAIRLLKNLPSYGCQPDVVSHNIILGSLCTNERWMDAKKLLASMFRRGFPSVLLLLIS